MTVSITSSRNVAFGSPSIGRMPSSRRSHRSSTILAASGRQPWDFGRFVRTVTTFNPPPTPAEVIAAVAVAPLKVIKPFMPQPPTKEGQTELMKVPVKLVEKPSARSGAMSRDAAVENAGPVVVAGSTTKLGRQVVAELLSKGRQVQALVRNSEEDAKMFQGLQAGPGGSLTVYAVPSNVLPEAALQGASAIISCMADAKEPEAMAAAVKEQKALIQASVSAIGLRGGKKLFDASRASPGMTWAPLDDVVMGGCSVSSFRVEKGAGEDGVSSSGIFTGTVSTDNSGGFSSIRTLNLEPPLDLVPYKGLRLQLKGDGLRYKFTLKTDANWDSVQYCQSFDTVAGTWQEIDLPFEGFKPVFRAKTMNDWAPLDPHSIVSMQLMLSKFEYDGGLNPAFRAGEFCLPLASVSAYMASPLAPRFVLVAPPAAAASLTGGPAEEMEACLQDSGVPFAIIQQSALSDSASDGSSLKDVKGRELMTPEGTTISRGDVSEMCVALLDLPDACNSTIYVPTSATPQNGASTSGKA